MAKQGGITIIYDASDLKRIARNLDAAQTVTPALFRAGLIGLSEKVLRRTKGEAPKDTGLLAESIEYTVLSSGFGNYESRFTEGGVPYGIFVREGTRPHMIFPREKKALWWDGLPYPVAFVSHPGTSPNMYHERSVKSSTVDFHAFSALIGNQVGVVITKGGM